MRFRRFRTYAQAVTDGSWLDKQSHHADGFSAFLGGDRSGRTVAKTRDEFSDQALVGIFKFSGGVTQAGTNGATKDLACFFDCGESQRDGFEISPAVNDEGLGFEIEFHVAFAAPEIDLNSPSIRSVGEGDAAGSLVTNQIEPVVFVR